MRFSLLACATILAAVLTADAALPDPADRRERQDPELVVESGGRLAYCDQILFTPDGKWVLTVGDDKVVRLWACKDGKLDPKSVRVLRWNLWREFRGAMYCAAVSHDPAGRYVAVGGVGELNTTVAVLDTVTGETVHYGAALLDLDLINVDRGKPLPFGTQLKGRRLGNYYSVRSITFSDDDKQVAFGTADGSVFVWDFKDFRIVGKHRPAPGGRDTGGTVEKEGLNRVRLVRFLPGNRLLSVAESAEVIEWDLSSRPAAQKAAWKASDYSVRVAALTPDNRWLALGVYGPVVALRSVDGKVKKDFALEEGQFVRSVAFDGKGEKLAVGVGSALPGDFFMEGDDHIRLYTVAGGDGRELTPIAHSGRAEAVAFHPAGGLLAVGGGNNHEVRLYDLEKNAAKVSEMVGAGACLWDVGLSADGNVLGFKDQRNTKSTNPNDRGAGAWRTFNLGEREFVPPVDPKTGKAFSPVKRLDTLDGWRVVPDKSNLHVWYAYHGKDRYRLEYDENNQGSPRCFTFIAGDTKNPPRLAVGHYWGLSVYELRQTPDAPEKDRMLKRVRLCVGHQGEVMALGVSADNAWLVSCANDQTIAAWALDTRWPSQALLGAAFRLGDDDRLRVKSVDAGSPAWEAGLRKGDEVKKFIYGGRPLKAADAKKRLEDPKPGVEHYFEMEREGKQLDMVTTVRQRPLWRFFATRDDEWVLWMWRNSFYDTSTRGDSYIGWLVNSLEPGHTPKFYQAEQFRKIFHKPTLIDRFLGTRNVETALSVLGDNPLPLRFDEREPPAVQISAPVMVDGGWRLTLTVTAYGTNDDLLPREAELWANNYRLVGPDQWRDVRTWDRVPDTKRPTFTKTVVVKADDLRAGENLLTFQTANRLGGRATTSTKITNPRAEPEHPILWALTVGIDRYSKNFKPPTRQVPGLPRDFKLTDLERSVKDADDMKNALAGLKYFQDQRVKTLTNEDATRDNILAVLTTLAATARPDDVCVISLSGHGLFRKADWEDNRKEEGEDNRKDNRSAFIFCCAKFEGDDPDASGLSSKVLYEKLTAIKCHKLVLLDACHSGQAASNPVRGLTPNSQGPVILAACDRNQQSYEHKKFDHGLFTAALLEALGKEMAVADRGERVLDTDKLYLYARQRVPEMLRDVGMSDVIQVPIRFRPDSRPFTIATR
jgi:WD40 repeat protein